MMAQSSSQHGVLLSGDQVASPYEQKFVDEMHEEFPYDGITLRNSNPRIFRLKWGRVPFDLSMQKTAETRYLELKISCNKGAVDHLWRCSYAVTVRFAVNNEAQTAERSFESSSEGCSHTLPITRLPENMRDFGNPTFRVNIKINSWSGIHPEPLNSFSEKTVLTDATLIVEGRRLYVSRSILAMQSKVFYQMFFDKKFTDWKKTEFELSNVSFADMLLFLHLIYPNSSEEERTEISSINTIEAMLKLADYFECSPITRLMEKKLMEKREDEEDDDKVDLLGGEVVPEGVRPSEIFLARLARIERSFGPDFQPPAEADRPGRAALLAEMDRDYDRRREPKPSSVEGFTPARGLLLADRYRLSALCTSIITELRYNDESLTAFYDSDERADLSEELLAVIDRVCERDRTHPRAPRATVVANIPDVDPDSPSARLAAIKHAAAAAARTRCSWSHFQTDVSRMLVAMPEYALTSAQLSTNFQEALLFLQSLSRREYASEITPPLRQLLHEIDILVGRQEFQDALVNAVGTVIGRVNRLRSDRAAATEDVEMADSSHDASDEVQWSQFVADVGTLREDAVFRENIWPTVLRQTLDFLLHVEQEAFARIASSDRSAMHGIIITLTRMMTRKHRSHGYVRDILGVLVEMVDKLRSDVFM